MVINNKLIDYYFRPSNNWNIHNDDQKLNKIILANNYFKNFMNENYNKIKSYINEIHKIFGNGFYSYDIILNNNNLYICEIGLKYHDYSYINYLKKNNINLNKISLNKHKLKKKIFFLLNFND